MTTNMLSWNKEMDEALKKSASDKNSTSETARLLSNKFGLKITKSCVVGRAYRIGVVWSNRPSESVKASVPKIRPVGEPFPSRRIPDLMECHYIGHDNNYCYKKIGVGETYCREHKLVIYQQRKDS